MAILFDFDGVIVNSKEAFVKSFVKVLGKNGYELAREQVIEKLVGSAPATIEALIGRRPDNFDDMVWEVRRNATYNEMHSVRVCNGVTETLDRLKKEYDLFLVTNSTQMFLDEFLKVNPMEHYFTEIVNSEKTGHSKEKGIRYVLEKYKLEPSKTPYVGDTKQDAEVALITGCKSIIIYNESSWHYGRLEEIKKLNPVILSSFREVGIHLNNNQK